MKKSALIIAFLLLGFFGFGQDQRPYVIRYQSQGDTIQHNTQFVSGIHIDTLGQELNYDNGTEWTSLADLDTVYIYRGDEVVNPNYVPIDWDNALLLSANDSIGDYQIQFNGGMPELQPGSIIAIDQDTVVRYIFIETVNVNGNTVSMTSTEAYLTDIFANTEFTLTTATNGKSSPQGKVFYPVAAYQRDEQGGYRALDLKRMRDNRWNFTHNLWHFGENYDGEELLGGDNYSVYMEYMNFDFDIDLELYINFGGRDVHEIVGEALDRYRSRTLMVRPALLGTFNTQQRVRCDIEGSCSYSPGYDIWKHDLFRPIDVKFVVYGVPIVITLNSDLYREVQVTAGGQISAYTGFADHAEGRIGFEWRQTGGMSPVTSFSNTFQCTPPTVEGQGTITAKVWAFPRVRLVLWHTLGPSFDFKPYLSVTLSGGFREELFGQSNDFCAWSLDCNTGLDAACGLSIQNPIFSYEIENYSTPNWNIIDRPLYHSPQRIEHNVAKGSGMKLGQRNEVSFTVYDRNHLFDTDVLTPLPQFVKFEGDGEISSEYDIANGGTVSVGWTPLSDGDVLYARLYDVDGNVISEAEVNAALTVTTSPVTNITQTTATGGGSITAGEYVNVTVRGICWSTSQNPTISDSHATSGSGMGSFTVNMTGLTPNTTYYVRAYAINEAGTVYGEEVSFTTETVLTVITSTVTNITPTTAMSGGEVSCEESCDVTERGICWSTSHNPIISDSHATSGSGTGSFTVNMTGLTPNTIYYVRAYAKNGNDYYYGEEETFFTCDCNMTSGDWVDLGLPSGLLWATRNVGASSPEDYGDYFAWGEIAPKGIYWSGNYLLGYWDLNGYYYTKYNWSDGLTTLLPEDDAATANYGGRMPTIAEWSELIRNTTYTWTTRNGVNGGLFTASNGNSLFLPAADFYVEDSCFPGYSCMYWSSSRHEIYFGNAWSFEGGSDGIWIEHDWDRCFGFSVRAVCGN